MRQKTTPEQRREWATKLKRRRKTIGWSQERLAVKSGQSLSYIQKLETAQRGNAEITVELLALMKSARKAETNGSGKRLSA